MAVEQGPVSSEVRLQTSAWASHVVRLAAGASHVEVEWTAGPIPVDTPWFDPVAYEKKTPLPNNWGKELVLRSPRPAPKSLPDRGLAASARTIHVESRDLHITAEGPPRKRTLAGTTRR